MSRTSSGAIIKWEPAGFELRAEQFARMWVASWTIYETQGVGQLVCKLRVMLDCLSIVSRMMSTQDFH